MAQLFPGPCAEVLEPERLFLLPAAIRERYEIQALTYGVLLHRDLLSHLSESEQGAYRAAYLAVLAKNMQQRDSTLRVLGALRGAGVRVVLLKGAALLWTHYGDLGMRAMDDIDLACAPEDVDRAVSTLVASGFACLERSPLRTGPGAVHDVRLTDGKCVLELHYRLWHESGIDGDLRGLMERSAEVRCDEERPRVPSLSDHLYLVLVHAALHGFAGNPLWLADAALLAAEATEQTWCDVHALAFAGEGRIALHAALDRLAACGLAPPVSDRVLGLGPRASARTRVAYACGSDQASVAPLRRWLIAKMSPWLERGEPRLGVWPSRLVRPLLFERPSKLLVWGLHKLRIWALD